MDNSTDGDIPTRILLDDETFDWLIAELEKPPKVNEKLVKLMRETQGSIVHK